MPEIKATYTHFFFVIGAGGGENKKELPVENIKYIKNLIYIYCEYPHIFYSIEVANNRTDENMTYEIIYRSLNDSEPIYSLTD